MIIAVASHNPVKIAACLSGFQLAFPDRSFEIHSDIVPSGVADQPFSDKETLFGAETRVENLIHKFPSADYWVGIEGGVEEFDNDLIGFAWIIIKSNQITGKARSGTFFLPPQVARLVRQGVELGTADDIVFGRTNSKQANGAVGFLTNNVITRKALYEHAVVLALAPFINPQLFH